MAIFRFELKSDRRKHGKGGERTSARMHAMYIDRAGKFKDIDEKDLARMALMNTITGPKLREHAPGRELFLYRSPFGVIKQDDSGILVSKNASIETVAIALKLASDLYGNELSFRGKKKFQEKIYTATSALHLPLSFASSKDEAAVAKKRKDDTDEREGFEQSGGRYIRPSIPDEYRGNPEKRRKPRVGRSAIRRRVPTFSESYALHPAKGEASERGRRVPALSGRDMDVSRSPRMLLPPDARHELQRRFKREYDTVKLRWDVSLHRRREIERVAREVEKNMQENLGRTYAASHVQYINRESAFKQRGGCLFTASHLPKWANGNAQVFFDAADRYERADGERYKEIVFSLPNELTLDQQKEMIQDFLDAHMQDYYYAYAIHDKVGVMSNGERHPHVHLMFSTRKIDAHEQSHERPPSLFFKRANEKDPSRGGCKKDALWNGKDRATHLRHLREDFARIQNDCLEKYGIPTRVDHRSLKARRMEALAKGDTFMAQLLDRVTEEAVGPLALLEKNNKAVAAQRKIRELNREHERNLVTKTILEDRTEQASRREEQAALAASFKELQEHLSIEERELFADDIRAIHKAEKDVQALMDAAVWSTEAIEDAMLSYMSGEEREKWQSFRALGAERKNWILFQKSLDVDSINPEIRAELSEAIEQKIASLTDAIRKAAKEIAPIHAHLSASPVHREILKNACSRLSLSRRTKVKIENALRRQAMCFEKLRAAYLGKQKEKNGTGIYTAGEVADLMQLSLHDLEKKAADLRKRLEEAKKETISPARAMEIAKNAYTHGAFKRIRRAIREERKRSGDAKTEKLTKLQKDMKKLEERCAEPNAKKKLQEIAAGVLRKNAPFLSAYQNIEGQYKTVLAAIQKARPLASAARHQSLRDRNKISYRLASSSGKPPSSTPPSPVIPPAGPTPPNSPPQNPQNVANGAPPPSGPGGGGGKTSYRAPYETIAQAISGDPQCGALVVRNKPNMPDEWALLSESERDELREKNAQRM